jgi:hypothetical protein
MSTDPFDALFPSGRPKLSPEVERRITQSVDSIMTSILLQPKRGLINNKACELIEYIRQRQATIRQDIKAIHQAEDELVKLLDPECRFEGWDGGPVFVPDNEGSGDFWLYEPWPAVQQPRHLDPYTRGSLRHSRDMFPPALIIPPSNNEPSDN